MKRIVFFVISLLCIATSSCKKDTPQDLLIGNWEVSISIVYEANVAGVTGSTTHDGGVWYYTFEENGHGRMADANDLTQRFWFTYQYDDLSKAMLLRRDDTEEDTIMEIDILTNESFIFHCSAESSMGSIISGKLVATYYGKKIK